MDSLEMQTTSTTGQQSNPRRQDAFTLVELILVMAIIVIAISITMPTLSRFFGGRAVDSEAKRFVALMHYGQGRAVSDGVPMMLWIDSTHRTYGLEQEPGYAGRDPLEEDNTLADGLKIDTVRNNVKQTVANSQTGRIVTGQVTQGKTRLPAIYFAPDGAINYALSVGGVSIQNANDPPVWIALNSSEMSYGIQKQNPASNRR
jgi:prepilin-type N-terminal cleavage/methylation domain-containing protein